jgi:hypothetical protein
MQRRYEENIIAILQFVLVFTLEFPVCVIDENEDAWTSVILSVNQRSLTSQPIRHTLIRLARKAPSEDL